MNIAGSGSTKLPTKEIGTSATSILYNKNDNNENCLNLDSTVKISTEKFQNEFNSNNYGKKPVAKIHETQHTEGDISIIEIQSTMKMDMEKRKEDLNTTKILNDQESVIKIIQQENCRSYTIMDEEKMDNFDEDIYIEDVVVSNVLKIKQELDTELLNHHDNENELTQQTSIEISSVVDKSGKMSEEKINNELQCKDVIIRIDSVEEENINKIKEEIIELSNDEIEIMEHELYQVDSVIIDKEITKTNKRSRDEFEFESIKKPENKVPSKTLDDVMIIDLDCEVVKETKKIKKEMEEIKPLSHVYNTYSLHEYKKQMIDKKNIITLNIIKDELKKHNVPEKITVSNVPDTANDIEVVWTGKGDKSIEMYLREEIEKEVKEKTKKWLETGKNQIIEEFKLAMTKKTVEPTKKEEKKESKITTHTNDTAQEANKQKNKEEKPVVDYERRARERDTLIRVMLVEKELEKKEKIVLTKLEKLKESEVKLIQEKEEIKSKKIENRESLKKGMKEWIDESDVLTYEEEQSSSFQVHKNTKSAQENINPKLLFKTSNNKIETNKVKMDTEKKEVERKIVLREVKNRQIVNFNKRIASIKKLLKTAGIKVKSFEELWSDCESDQQKIDRLNLLLEKGGVSGRPTLEKCRAAKLLRKSNEVVVELESETVTSDYTT